MRSIILNTATRYLLPLMLLFSFFIWLRGHNEPGGGFVGGLVAAAAYVLYSIAFGVRSAQVLLRVSPRILAATGLALALVSGLLGPLLANETFMTGLWSKWEIPILQKVGTPLLFDAGVYLTVVGITLWIIFALAEAYLEDPTDTSGA